MNTSYTNSNYQSYAAMFTAQTGSRQLAAQVSHILSELTVALPMAAENMVGFNKKGPAKTLLSKFVITELYCIHHVNQTTLGLFFNLNSAIIY